MNTRDALEFFGILGLACSTLVFAALWWAAFLTGDAVRMTVAAYGEHYLEAALWFVAAPVMLFALYSYLKRLPTN